MSTLILVIAILVLGGFVALSYNALVQRRNQVKNAWSQIDVQLKRRIELIPNLVETVKGYANFEQKNFTRGDRCEKYCDRCTEYSCEPGRG